MTTVPGPVDLDVRQALDVVTEAAARLSVEVARRTAALETFLAGPPVVRVVGPPTTDRARLAAVLAGGLPSVRVGQADVADFLDDPWWDLAVVVTPAERPLARAEEQIVSDAVAAGRPVVVLVTRLELLAADEAARAAVREELERFQLIPTLQTRGVPWWFASAGTAPLDGPPLAGIRAAVDGQRDHLAAARQVLRGLVDDLLRVVVDRLEDRRARSEEFASLRALLAAQGAYLQDAAQTGVLASIEDLRRAQEAVFSAADGVVELARRWLATDGVVPWPDVEHPLRRACTGLRPAAEALIPDRRAALNAEIARVDRIVSDGLGRLGLDPQGPAADPSGSADDASLWDDPVLQRALARYVAVDPRPVLAAVHDLMDEALSADRTERPTHPEPPHPEPPHPEPPRPEPPRPEPPRPEPEGDRTSPGGPPPEPQHRGTVGQWVRTTARRAGPAVRQVGETLQGMASDEADVEARVRGLLITYLDAHLQPRTAEAITLARVVLARASRGTVDVALERIDARMDEAGRDLDRLHAATGVRQLLVDLQERLR